MAAACLVLELPESHVSEQILRFSPVPVLEPQTKEGYTNRTGRYE
jgi:hypothetical protein